jgi:NAD(P)-dependent dehydrogenase (short-subunit alcohol dehydrogenase family)
MAAQLEAGETPSRAKALAFVVTGDVTREADVQRVVEHAGSRFGHVDVFCSNAGLATVGDEHLPDSVWELEWRLHVLSHVYAARAVVPGMRARRSGYLLNVISSAGLNTQLGAAPYATTKRAALAFAEWLSIQHGDAGVCVSAFCPRAIDTPLLSEVSERLSMPKSAGGNILSAAAAAEFVVRGIEEERFLIVSHQETKTFVAEKAADYDAWISKMRASNAALAAARATSGRTS